ncbi:hypothetical protein T01_999 [Trichinella spiralis]|uniref:Uncharacterized protein n=1 Tax=Trichinella spiralis TaxID=6334 RepID=A0A0V1ALA2_TRISP|nr:hypothetical protein T01_999 [Trichinella spiralis]
MYFHFLILYVETGTSLTGVNEILENMHVDDLVFSIHEEEGFSGVDAIANSNEAGGFPSCKMCQ